MKNLLIALFALLTVGASAQLKPGVRLGLHYASIDASGEGIEFGAQTSYTVGVFNEFALTDRLSLQPELMFTQRDAIATAGLVTIGGGDYTSMTRSIDLPVLAKVNLRLPKDTGVYFLGGPQFTVNTRHEYRIGSVADNVSGSVRDLNRTELGLVGGAGVKLLGFFVDGRYQHGVTKRSVGEPVLGDTYNRGWTLSLGYQF